MARGTQLSVLLEDLRAEAGHAIQPSLGAGTRDVLRKILQRQQKRLWEDFNWPHLRIKRDVVVAAGQRYYDIPDDLSHEKIERIEFKWGDRWQVLGHGITFDHLNQYDSDRDIRSYPVYNFEEHENDQVEVWPIPSQNGSASTTDGVLRFTGIKNLSPFVADADKCDLDDQMIVLYSASELLARQNANDAQAKLAQATQHYNRLRARANKTRMFVFGDEEPTTAYQPKGPPMVSVTSS